MVSPAMDAQEQHEGTGSDTSLPTNNKMSLDLGTPVCKSIQLKEQFNPEDDFSPKARKPYTITKQRERWTEEEHKKFLEALKLYGRAWRRIEEHVGTKTAVQIRSHAQKFFSKVARDSNCSDADTAKPIEIPPPRPKRKPMHPYPRKLVCPAIGISIPEKPMRSASSSLSLSEQENQSPTSVLSAVGSDASAAANSCVQNGSLSPVSSGLALNSGAALGSKDEYSSLDEQVSPELELLYQNNSTAKEDSNEAAVQCLKLFGKTLLVTNTHGPSDFALGTSKLESLEDRSGGTCLYPWSVMPVKLLPSNPENVWSSTLSQRSPLTLYCSEIKSDLYYTQVSSTKKSNPVDTCYPVPLPWLTLCDTAPLSTQEVHNPIPIKAGHSCDKNETPDKDDEKEGSSTGSNTDLVCTTGEGEKNWDVDSGRLFFERKSEEEKSPSYKLSKLLSANSVNSGKGFVPYKRCLGKRASTISSTETAEESEKQRVRLCL